MDIAVTRRFFGANYTDVQILFWFLEQNHILALKLRVNLFAGVCGEIVSQAETKIFRFNHFLEVFF